MQTTFTPGQQDALVESLLRPDPAGHGGRSRLVPPAGLPADEVSSGWQRVVDANPYLGTALILDGGDGVPVPVPEPVPPELIVTDAADVAHEPGIRLTDGDPLCRLTVISTGDDVTELVLDHHPLLLDRRSARIVLEEVVAAAGGHPARPLPASPDYLAWLDGQDLPRIESFWRQRLGLLDGATPLLDERHDDPIATERVAVALDPDRRARLTEVAARLDVPESWVVLLAWGVVVCRFRGGEDSAVGVLADLRPACLPDALGAFESVLPYVVEFDRTPLPVWLERQAAAVRDLIRCGHLSTAHRNDLAGTERGTVLYDSVVEVRDPDPLAEPGRAPAALLLSLAGDRLVLDLDPRAADAEQARRYLRSAVVVLDAFATAVRTGSAGDVASVSLLDDAARTELHAHNATAADYPAGRCLHQLVEAQVDLRPNDVALVYEGTTLTYRELDERANRLAHELLARGVRTDSMVGLCSEPSLELCIGILAIHKAGAAYAPLDPFFPEERLSYLYGDLNCSIVLCQARHLDRLPRDGRTLLLDDEPAWASRPASRPEVPVGPDNLAYVMYTSGSTGRPKGVLIEHRGAVNFLWWMVRRFDLAAGEAALQWTAYSFDAAVWELFWPLVVGGRAVVAPAKIHLDLARFIDLIVEQRVVTLHFVPAMLQTFLSSAEAARCASLRHVFVSGEPVPVSLMNRFHELLEADLINLYGVTEVSIDSTSYVCERGGEFGFVRSGVPLSNTQTYVLDERLRPIPFGARGEVFIGGDSVTRGYLNRRELTADRFVPDPFGNPGSRMYRTGDVAQLLPDGHLRFLGRGDHQVKIRGIRVELLEVAAELNDCPGVRESLVVAFGEGSDRGLAAYLVGTPGARLEPPRIRDFMAGRVPPYMVPNVVVVLAEFPLNNNGKIDRKALPAPNDELLHTERRGRAPEGEVEEEIAGIWCRLLELPEVGADEEFFGVGGNSLLATRVIAEVRRRFEIDLPLREWLEAGTVAQLAAAVERRRPVALDRAAREALQLLDEVELDAAAG